VNDARAIAATLGELGFEVLAHENLGQREMRRAILRFGERLREDGGVGLFYFAGHGVQASGRNYLIPTDAVIASEGEIEIEAVDVAAVLSRMESANNRLNIAILDACRDNPFASRSRSASRGLASIDAPSGTIIAYATAPGRVAADGAGANGLYTSELLKAVRLPGLPIEEVFKHTRRAVQAASRGAQVPWESSSLVGAFFFAPLAPVPRPADSPPPAAASAQGPTARSVPRTGGIVVQSPRDYSRRVATASWPPRSQAGAGNRTSPSWRDRRTRSP
jgi:uncharacterized caspase-like protein